MTENLLLIYQSLPYLLKGSIVTLKLIGGALGLGFIIGIPMAIGQVYGNKYICWFNFVLCLVLPRDSRLSTSFSFLFRIIYVFRI